MRERHGHKQVGKITPTYRTWLGMKRRCSDPKCKDFANWGGRGIRVCERWDRSFVSFLADMGEKPGPDFTIDRLDPDADYSPDNCRWAPQREQGALNRRGLRAVTVNGEAFPSLRAACRRYGVSPTTLSERLARGIDLMTAITTPTRGLVNKRTRESYLPRATR